MIRIVRRFLVLAMVGFFAVALVGCAQNKNGAKCCGKPGSPGCCSKNAAGKCPKGCKCAKCKMSADGKCPVGCKCAKCKKA